MKLECAVCMRLGNETNENAVTIIEGTAVCEYHTDCVPTPTLDGAVEVVRLRQMQATIAARRPCRVCGRELTGRKDQRYCGDACRQVACRQRRESRRPRVSLTYQPETP